MDALFDDDAGQVDYQTETDILEDEEITQEDAWVVIDKYFLERGQFLESWYLCYGFRYLQPAGYAEVSRNIFRADQFRQLSIILRW